MPPALSKRRTISTWRENKVPGNQQAARVKVACMHPGTELPNQSQKLRLPGMLIAVEEWLINACPV